MNTIWRMFHRYINCIDKTFFERDEHNAIKTPGKIFQIHQTQIQTHTHNRTFEELAILPNGTVNETYRPLTISMYHLHMHRWLEVFSREQLLVVNGDQLIEDPVSQLRRIETFLGMYSMLHNIQYELLFIIIYAVTFWSFTNI